MEVAPDPPDSAGGSDPGVKKWERPWSITEMKQGASNWMLANDAGVSVCVCVCYRLNYS